MDRLQQALYWPANEDEEILRLSDRKPCRAAISNLEGDIADLIVTDHFGSKCIRLSVPISRQPLGQDWCMLI